MRLSPAPRSLVSLLNIEMNIARSFDMWVDQKS